ncbi:LamG domain-containing protein [Micromonospora sp. AMSO12t]|uniref:LamG domain-containing protein n=1 Tax=Micromonospora sp. AMSO12t TaxID=2650410 RepID=UPI00124BC8B6|nr:LamG domain-containing protein [Micromonospora sp. AMSO12t]KAB1162168.1 LamG domain-containing protein [Micromonospora sp. AMSO12t]
MVAPSAVAAPTPAAQRECGSAEAPDEAAAARLAAACGRPVEALSERTEYAHVTVAPDGVRKLVAAVAPQRVRRADGSWAAIDPGLRQRGDRLVPTATLADVSFSTGGAGPLVTWREAGSTFTLGWPLGSLPKPQVNGPTATYPSVLKGVNLHVTATAEGYTHVVEVLTPEAAAQPAIKALRYRTGGDMRIAQAADGAMRLVTAAGVTVATSAPARMWDSSHDPARAGEVLPAQAAARLKTPRGERATATEPAVTSRSAKVRVAASRAQFTVTPDAELMADPGLTYPIYIDPQFEKLRTKWAYSTSNGENNDTTVARVGRQPYPEGGNGERYRSYYDFNVSGLKGKQILGGTIRVTLDHSYSCDPTWVYAYRTNAITVASGGRMAWTTRPLPATYLDSWEGNANEAGGCGAIQPDDDAEFSSTAVVTDLQQAATNAWSVYTVGLCACNPSGVGEDFESRWKKFYTNKAWLEVTYNSKPAVPTGLTTSGQACGATIGTASPVLKAFYGDADGATDSLVGYFQYRLKGTTTVTAKTGQTKPGNNYGESGVISLGAGSEGKTYEWQVQTRDRAGQYSGWTAWCSFTVDVSKPLPPTVTSTAYPDDGSAHGGPGVSGAFTFGAGSQDAVKYVYGWAGQTTPLTTVTVAAGASYTVTLTPRRFGYNVLEVYSVDSASKRSDTTGHRFLVNGPSAPVAHWPLDSVDSHYLKNVQGGPELSWTGNSAWAADSRLYGESTASFDRSSHLSGDVALDTSKSFSVAAWVNLADADTTDPDPDLPTGNWTAVSKSGANVGAFYLGARLDSGQPRWSFMLTTADAGQGNSVTTVFSSGSLTTRDVGRWTHLAGAYDAGTGSVTLYVNGVVVGSDTRTSAGWNASGPAVIGGAMWTAASGAPYITDRWRGQITDVRMWNRVLTSDDLNGTDEDAEAGTQAVSGIMAPIEVANWDFNGALSSGCQSAMSVSYWQQYLDLYGCTDPYSAAQNVGYTGDGYDDNDALWLNGPQPDGWGSASTRSGYAGTSDAVVNTGQSLTVSAAVRINALADEDQVMVRQGLAADQEGAFKLYMNRYGELSFTIASPDGAGGVTWASTKSDVRVTADALGAWIHLVGVFDAGSGEVRLYVNGVRQAAVATGATGGVSRQPLYVGANGSWNGPLLGDIDQIKVYAGAMSDREARALHRNS